MYKAVFDDTERSRSEIQRVRVIVVIAKLVSCSDLVEEVNITWQYCENYILEIKKPSVIVKEEVPVRESPKSVGKDGKKVMENSFQHLEIMRIISLLGIFVDEGCV